MQSLKYFVLRTKILTVSRCESLDLRLFLPQTEYQIAWKSVKCIPQKLSQIYRKDQGRKTTEIIFYLNIVQRETHSKIKVGTHEGTSLRDLSLQQVAGTKFLGQVPATCSSKNSCELFVSQVPAISPFV